MASPLAIEVRDVEKTFRIPEHRVDSLKERAAHPFTRIEYRDLQALRGVSFDVHQGEFFGIVGRNGSGKSTLLKVMASIYRADSGRVRMAGRLAPFIELGVGFNPELTARENGVLNGVLMGLGKREARRRLDAVLEFAGLEDFVELKLKNYSSGMMVRLAFAVMVQADADIMLIDEVLAVGDAAFAQKCMEVFEERRRASKTVVLVTHDMGMIESLCDRAMLLHDGEVRYTGSPEETAVRYYRINLAQAPAQPSEGPRGMPEAGNATLVGARPLGEVAQGAPLSLDVLLEARRDLHDPSFVVNVLNGDGVVVFSVTASPGEDLPAGRRMRLAGELENPLVPGSYTIDCWVRRRLDDETLGVQGIRLAEFSVTGAAAFGMVSVRGGLEAVAELDVSA